MYKKLQQDIPYVWVGSQTHVTMIFHDELEPTKISDICVRDDGNIFHVFDEDLKYVGMVDGISGNSIKEQKIHPALQAQANELQIFNAKHLLEDTFFSFLTADIFAERRKEFSPEEKIVINTVSRKLNLACKIN